MISGNAEVRWELHQQPHGETTPASACDEFTSETEAREAFDEACEDRSIGRATLKMVIHIEAASHFKSKGAI